MSIEENQKFKKELESASHTIKNLIVLKSQKSLELSSQLEVVKACSELYRKDVDWKAQQIAIKDAQLSELSRAFLKTTNFLVEKEKQKEQQENQFDGMIRAQFFNISTLIDRSYDVSKRMKLIGVEWELIVSTPYIDEIKYLSVFLRLAADSTPPSWSCSVFFSINLRSHNMDNPIFSWSSEESFQFNSICYIHGTKTFIAFEYLLDPLTGYVKNDSILLEVEVAAFPSKF
ncbi:hypothetical protein PFISCL1PPCAC_20289 [Pristionchus fissidentatus]|uniref:MATH domain-containing protein n=1 Tax=Pristionchus fissidentatus TaxID=1538716 RepID=A0AAV5WGC2_9BILA|nr:hypothetical protein PFISCL1PPCAC_20289 [Pristionchus fissidentatus]